MRTTYTHITFKCTKCDNTDIVLHQCDPWTECPKCSKCGAPTDVAKKDTSVDVGISFRGISTPGRGTPTMKSMFPQASSHPTVGPWLEKRTEQIRKTGK